MKKVFFSRSSLLKINQTTEQPKRDHRTRKQRLIIDGRAAGESKTFFYVPVQVHLVRRLVVPLLPGHRQARRASWSSSPSAPSIGGRDALKASSSVSFECRCQNRGKMKVSHLGHCWRS